MTNSFRVDASELQAWHAALTARMELRGVPALAKEMEAHLMKKADDGTVVVTRHQLFTWAEALSGAAARDPRGSSAGAQLSLAQVVADMRGILTGKPSAAPGGGVPGAGLSGPGAGAATGTGTGTGTALSPGPATTSSGWGAPAPPAVVYRPAGATIGAGNVVSGNDLANAVRELIRGAQTEICVSSPWATGVETLVNDLVAAAPHVKVLIVSRRPDKDEPAFHQAMDKLGRRKAITAWSSHIQTRYVIADGKAALVGAASIPIAASREAAVALTDPATVSALRAHFDRCHVEAAGGRY